MGIKKEKNFKIGDTVTHTDKLSFWDVDKHCKGIGLIMSTLYRLQDQKYVHDVWFEKIGLIQQIGAGALVRINQLEANCE